MIKITKFVKSNTDIILTVVLGTILRTRLILKDEMGYDEALLGLLMRSPRKIFWEYLGRDTHPPLYNLLLKLWTTLWGVTDLSLRFLPLVFGILTIILVYLTAKKIFGKNAALIAAVLAAVNPFLISYSIEAKSYSCYGLVLLLTVYFLVSKKISLFALSYLVALNLHYMSLLFAPPIFIFYTYLLITKKIRLKTTLPQTAMLLVGTLLTYYIVLQKGPTTWIRGANFWNIPRSLIAYSYGVQAKLASSNALNELSFPLINSYILGGVIVTLWIVSLAIAWHKSKEHEREGLAFMVMLIVIPQPTVTFFLISVGYVLTKLLSFEVMALILIAYTFTLTKIKPPDYNVGMKTLAKTFSTSPQEIVFTSPSDFTVGEYYLGADVKLYDPKNPEEPHSALYISSDSDKMTADFQEVDYPTDFGSYKVYTKIH